MHSAQCRPVGSSALNHELGKGGGSTVVHPALEVRVCVALDDVVPLEDVVGIGVRLDVGGRLLPPNNGVQQTPPAQRFAFRSFRQAFGVALKIRVRQIVSSTLAAGWKARIFIWLLLWKTSRQNLVWRYLVSDAGFDGAEEDQGKELPPSR